MFRISKIYLKLGLRHVSGEREATIICHYWLHVSPLHVKFAMIMGTNAKRRLTWGNGSDRECGLGDIGLHTEQM